MLRKNKVAVVFLTLFSVLILSSCIGGGVYVDYSSFSYTIEILNKDDIQSDKIKIERNTILNNRPYVYLYNVACSLRNDVEPSKIIASEITTKLYNGEVGFCFTTNKKNSESCGVYFDDETKYAEECDAQTNNTSKYYIVINDPDLDGYDSNYETVKRYCHESLANTPVYLGAKKTE